MTEQDPKTGGKIEPQDWYLDAHATFGDRLATAREAQGLERADLASNLGVDVSSIDAWEEDQREPRANRLQMIAGVLGVSLAWLITGQGQGIPAPGEARPGGLPAEVLDEVRKLRRSLARADARLERLEHMLEGDAA